MVSDLQREEKTEVGGGDKMEMDSCTLRQITPLP